MRSPLTPFAGAALVLSLFLLPGRPAAAGGPAEDLLGDDADGVIDAADLDDAVEGLLSGEVLEPEADPDSSAYASFVKKFDRDGDGKLSEDEKEAGKKSLDEGRMNQLKKRLSQEADADHDGELDPVEKDELQSLLAKHRFCSAAYEKKIVAKFDSDLDGGLDKKELAKLKQAWKKHQASEKDKPKGVDKGKDKEGDKGEDKSKGGEKGKKGDKGGDKGGGKNGGKGK